MKINSILPSGIQRFISCFVVCCAYATSSLAQPALGTTSFATGVNVSLVATGACTGGRSAISSGYVFTINSAVNCAINNAFNVDSDGHINLISTPTTSGIWQEGRFGSSDGSKFKLNDFMFSVLTAPFVGKTLTVTGYRDGVLVPGATIVSPVITATSLANSYTVDVASMSAFGNIDEVRLVPSGTDAQGTLSIRSINISSALSTLPVNFQQLTAFMTPVGVKVSFITSEESNIRDYEIQTGADGLNFTTQHRLTARNGDINHYETSVNAQAGNMWVRIKSNEFDGTFKYSKVVLVQNNNARSISVYPNPASDVLYVSGSIDPTYMIRDLQGRVLAKGKVNNGMISISNLSPGIYSLLTGGQSFKIIKR